MKKNLKIIFVLFFVMMIFLLPKNAQANVQSRADKGRLANKWIQDFFELIRKMETSTAPMGLTATVEQQTDESGNTKIVESTSSNNIDVHMIKNTEWGAVAILWDSGYGSKSTSGGTTTGNTSGVYQFFSGLEYVAGMWDKKNSYNGKLYYSDSKYWDKYTEATGKTGDGTTETPKWKGASSASFVSGTNPVFMRGDSGAFYFRNGYGYGDAYSGSRAAVVCGSRILDVG